MVEGLINCLVKKEEVAKGQAEGTVTQRPSVPSKGNVTVQE